MNNEQYYAQPEDKEKLFHEFEQAIRCHLQSAGDGDAAGKRSRGEPRRIGGYGDGGGGRAVEAVELPVHFEPGIARVREVEGNGGPVTAGDIDRLGNGGAGELAGKRQRGLVHNDRLRTQAERGSQHEQRQHQVGNRKNSLHGRTSKKGGQFGRENATAHKSLSTAGANWRFLTKT